MNRLEGLLVASSLTWTATPLTTARFYSTTSIDETTVPGVSGVLTHTYTAEVDHDFRRWLTAIGKFMSIARICSATARGDSLWMTVAGAAIVLSLALAPAALAGKVVAGERDRCLEAGANVLNGGQRCSNTSFASDAADMAVRYAIACNPAAQAALDDPDVHGLAAQQLERLRRRRPVSPSGAMSRWSLVACSCRPHLPGTSSRRRE